MVQLLYKGTGLVVLFLTVFWIVLAWLRKLERQHKEKAAAQLAASRRNVVNR